MSPRAQAARGSPAQHDARGGSCRPSSSAVVASSKSASAPPSKTAVVCASVHAGTTPRTAGEAVREFMAGPASSCRQTAGWSLQSSPMLSECVRRRGQERCCLSRASLSPSVSGLRIAPPGSALSTTIWRIGMTTRRRGQLRDESRRLPRRLPQTHCGPAAVSRSSYSSILARTTSVRRLTSR